MRDILAVARVSLPQPLYARGNPCFCPFVRETAQPLVEVRRAVDDKHQKM
jgi:hypothetical protein